VQQILAEMTEHERAQAMRLANAIGENAFNHFFGALQRLDQLIMAAYQKEQQLELQRFRPGGLSDQATPMKDNSAMIATQTATAVLKTVK